MRLIQRREGNEAILALVIGDALAVDATDLGPDLPTTMAALIAVGRNDDVVVVEIEGIGRLANRCRIRPR